MANGVTNRGKDLLLAYVFRPADYPPPTNFYIHLITSAVTPTVDTNTLSELTQIATGNGYTTAGVSLSKNSTDFDTITEDDTLNLAYIQIKDITLTATGGSMPPSGNGARYAVMCDDNATVGDRVVICWWDLLSDQTKTVGQTLTLQDLTIRAT